MKEVPKVAFRVLKQEMNCFSQLKKLKCLIRFVSCEVRGGPFTIKEKLWNVSDLNGGSTIMKMNMAEVISNKCVGDLSTCECEVW